MYTAVHIINLGLGILSSSRVNTISPPRTSLETYMHDNYRTWKRSELTKHNWVFATEVDYPLTLETKLTFGEKPYKFAMPNDCVRPVRRKYIDWEQRGRYIYSAGQEVRITYVREVPESDFDPLFVDVLAARVAESACEYVTQSNTKKADAQARYKDAIMMAKQANAFVVGPQDKFEDDNQFPFVSSRYQ